MNTPAEFLDQVITPEETIASDRLADVLYITKTDQSNWFRTVSRDG